jgi:hypothetical protein
MVKVKSIKDGMIVAVPAAIAKLMVARGNHIYEGDLYPIKEKDAAAYIEKRMQELREWEAQLEAREKQLETRKRKPKTEEQ